MSQLHSDRRPSWPITVMGGKYLAIRAGDVQPHEDALAPEAAFRIIQRAMNHPHDPGQLHALSRAVTGFKSSSGTVNGSAIENAFRSGKLRLLRQQARTATHWIDARENIGEQLRQARVVKTWIEFEVVDTEGRPVPDETYLCMLPDGSKQEGRMDRTGKVRFDGIDPGNCVFFLKDIDGGAWSRAS
mgnify:CR=1 FL=1